MKTTRTLLLALTLSGALVGTGSAQTSISAGIHIGPSGRTSVDLGFFYDDLAPYGTWVQRPQYGWVWRPQVERSSWRPYEDGHWVWTDEGWTWISDEPYGWATYHYGRWYDDPDYGWEWVPGDEWAPAWVSWQESDDYVGWAPLPPSVDFRPGVTLNVSLAPDYYVFVPSRQFLAPRIVDYVVPRTQYRQIITRTRNVTRYNRVNNRIFNQGVAVDRIQRVTGRTVTRYQVSDARVDDRRGTRIVQNRVTVFRPQVQRVKVVPPDQRPAWKRARETRVQATRPAPDQRERAQIQRERAQENRQQAQSQQRQAEENRQRAQAQQQRAQAQQRRAIAERQRAEALQQRSQENRQRAQVNRQQAQAQQRRAEANRQRAQAQRQKAQNQRQKANQGKPPGNHKQKPPQ